MVNARPERLFISFVRKEAIDRLEREAPKSGWIAPLESIAVFQIPARVER